MNKLAALAFATLLICIGSTGDALAQARQFEKPGPCDRACLIKLADDYLAALVAHDRKAVPLAADLRFVENLAPTQAGEGPWGSRSAYRSSGIR